MAAEEADMKAAAKAQEPDGEEGLPSCGEVGWLSYLTFSWVNPLVGAGRKRQVDLADFPKLAQAEDTLGNGRKLLSRLECAEQRGSRHPLLRAVALGYWKELLALEVLLVAQHFLGLLKPLALKRLLVFQEAQQHGKAEEPGVLSTGVVAIAGLILLNLFEMLYSTHVHFFRERLNLRIASALRGTVLARCVEGRIGHAGSAGAADGGPAVYNVLSFDVGPNIEVIWIVLGLWIFPVKFSSTLGVLIHEVKAAAVPGLLVIVAAKLVVGGLLFFDGLCRHKLLQAKDQRLGSCNEGFNQIRTLQMLSWVSPFEDRILEARRTELHYQARRLWLGKMAAALDYSLSTIVTLATFAYFTRAMGVELKASVALPVIELIKSLIGPFGDFPIWINQYLVWKSAYGRVNDFLGLGSPGAADEDAEANPAPASCPAEGGAVAELRSCTLSWGGGAAGAGEEPEAFSLQGLDLDVRPAEILVLLGPEAQGKSSLLQALLGEMALESGSLRSPAFPRRCAASVELLPATTLEARQLLERARDGSADLGGGAVPYAAQEVLLMTGTVRWNVLFGARADEALYQETLRACALEADLQTLPSGDLTEVAQGGANLSGGQRARVGLARAAYRAALLARERPEEPPLVLLDEPLCSLDRRVARDVCTQLLAPPSGLLSGCAVVVAAADPWFLDCLPAGAASPRLAVLRAGRAAALGTRAELAKLALPELGGGGTPHAPPTHEAPAAAPEAAAADGDLESAGEEAEADAEPAKGAQKLVEDEARVAGCVRRSTYLKYLRSVGCAVLFWTAVALTGIMLFQKFCDLWIVYWTAEKRTETRFYRWWSQFVSDHPPSSPNEVLQVYAVFVLLFTIANVAGHALEIVGGIGAARRIFNEALRGTLARPFGWWDANPTGRVLNRFSEDVEVMDLAITNILGIFFGGVLFLTSHSLVLAIANPISLAVLPVIVLVFEYYARQYRRTVREVQRIYLASMGTVYQEMVEAILGRVTIRAFGATERFLCSGLDRLDRFQRSAFTRTCVQSWVKLRMALIGYTLGLYNTLQPLLQYLGLLGGQSAALVGFSINYSHDIVAVIQQLVLNWSDIEMQLVSIERLIDYAERDGARERVSAELPPGEQGLRLTDVEVCYREGLRPALSGVSLSFPPRQVVAVMGRTGAGKSSLLLSVMQLVPYQGRIEVGGRDLSQLDASDVRRRLVGVVPQRPVLFAGSIAWNLDPEGLHSEASRMEALRAVGLEAAACAAGSACAGKQPGAAAAEASAAPLALSAGQRQLLCAARALLRRPRVALLDEVTSSLPSETAGSTVEALLGRFRERNTTVLLVTHQEELLASCERVITIAGGRLVGDRSLAAASAVDPEVFSI